MTVHSPARRSSPFQNQLPLELPEAITHPNPRRLVRSTDSAGSISAAVDLVESGRDALQVSVVTMLVLSLPGRTSLELAHETAREGLQTFGFPFDRWRYLLARRLSEAESDGRGPILGSKNSPDLARPFRLVDSAQPPCKYAGTNSLRWWPKAMKAVA
jgi:hypothetical protein